MISKMKKLLYALIIVGLLISPVYASDLAAKILLSMGQASGIRGMSGLTFYADYSNSGINADKAKGSPVATVTATRSASNPATTIDAVGNITLVTNSNTIRFPKGKYTVGGFSAANGILIEPVRTNSLKDSYFANATITTNWRAISAATISRSTTYTNPYLGGSVAKIVTSSDNDGLQTSTSNLPSFGNGNTYTVSCLIRGSGTVNIFFQPTGGTKRESTAITLNDDGWSYYWFYNTASVAATGNVGIEANGANSVTCYVAYMQCEYSGAGASRRLPSSFIPTTTTALTRNAESLSYSSSGNRNDVETIVVKVNLPYVGAVAAYRKILDDNGDRRVIYDATIDKWRMNTNFVDSTTCLATLTTALTANTNYIIAGVAQHSSPYAQIYLNGTSEATYTSGDYTTYNPGTAFYVGVRYDGIDQFNGYIEKIAIFNRALSQAEIVQVGNLFNQVQVSQSAPPDTETNGWLLENGDYWLLENGDYWLLEN